MRRIVVMVRELCNEQAMCDIHRPYAEIADYLDGSNRFSNGQLVFHGAIVPLGEGVSTKGITLDSTQNLDEIIEIIRSTPS
jgi:hypothetical protein